MNRPVSTATATVASAAAPAVGRFSREARSLLTRAARAVGLPGRGVWSRPGRHHIEVRGVAELGGERLARRVERMLGELPGVAWARVNAPSGRVVVAVTDPEPRLDDLIAVIAAAERNGTLDPDPDLQPHPPEEGPHTRGALSTIAADAVGLGLSALTRILPYTPVPAEVAGLAGAIDLHPRLHELTGRALQSQGRADSLFPLVEAVAQGLAGRWAGIMVDGVQRVVQWREARSQLATWGAAEDRLAGTPERAAAGPTLVERPRPLPDGPAQRYAAQVLAAGGVIGAAALPLAGFNRAAALALSALPKAPAAGQEAYAAQLGRVLARRGVIAMDRSVLRQLDRIDTLLLDRAVLVSDRTALTDLLPLAEADAEEVAGRAFTLFDPDDAATVRRADGWSLGPLDRVQVSAGAGEPEARRLAADDAMVLGLVRDSQLVALVKAQPQPAPGMEALVQAARRSGLRLAVAGEDGQRYRFADTVVPGDDRLVASVRSLQADGCVVMLVSDNHRALGAADCGLGVCHPDEKPPWGAHLLLGNNLDLAAMVVEAAGTASTVAAQSIHLAQAGSGLGALLALTCPPERLPRPTLATLNATAGIAVVNGLWRARRLQGWGVGEPAAADPWHLMPVDTVLARLRTGPAGLDPEEAQRRRSADRDGPERPTLARAFAEELANPLTPVLGAGAAISAAVGSPVDAGLVGGVIALSALIGAAQRVNTERSLAELLSRSAVEARVRRGGPECTVLADDLVPGDIVVVGPGQVIPADCRILSADGLEADESSLTGESLPVTKTARAVFASAVAERTSMLYEGTTVAAGRGVAVVVATGASTEVGRGMALAREAPPPTGVEERLSGLARTAVPLAVGSAAAIGGAGLLRGVPLTETAATAANLAVASVPEGLPFLVSAAQLAAARRLAENGALVRNPRTIEALGRVDVLCFDKTGTLTEGALTLAGVGSADRYAGVGELDPDLRRILAAALRATPPAERPEEVSGQTDRAVLAGAARAGGKVDTGLRGWRLTTALPFEPSRGYHAAVGMTRGQHLLSVKGAPEIVLPRCARVRGKQGDRALDEAGREALRERLERQAGAGHRILAVAECLVPGASISDDDVRGLTFLGFISLADAVRESAAPAVRRIREAGVHTIMITGDHPATAAAIAATISPDDSQQRVVTGAELDQLDDDALADLLPRTDVVARCTPSQKVRIITTLQRRGRTVAMTGDGANDAPAIRLADIGMALGRRGTPAARAAADLIVTDDRLETIISALIEGRAMWSSVRHALSILVGGNLGEIAFSVLTAAITGRSALNGRQLLLVNLLTDLAPAMAIATRPPAEQDHGGLLGEGPDTSLGGSLTRELALRATSTTLGASTAWTLARYTGTPRRASTVALAALVGTQLGQTVLAGGTNPSTVAAGAVSAAALAGIIQTPGLSQFFGCTPLGPVGWGIASGSAVGATLANATLKRLVGNHLTAFTAEPEAQPAEVPAPEQPPAKVRPETR
ncbi:MAG TPA: HAD-IC family P-type ATPase [Micromonosporaceae bacterium]